MGAAVGFLLCALSFLVFFLRFHDTYAYVFSLQLGLLFAASFFLYRGDIKSTLASLGVPGDLKRNALYFLGGLSGMLLLLLLLGGVYYILGIKDSQNVVLRIQGLPVAILALAILLAPISEELFFRAFLSARTGIWLSSALFAVSHVAYGSIAELISTFALGAWLTFIYRRSGSILPPIAIHLVFNLFSILVMKLVLS